MFIPRVYLMATLCAATPVFAGPVPFDAPNQISPYTQVQTSNVRFNRWISGFRTRALNAGISPANFDRAFGNISYNDSVIDLDRNQSAVGLP